MNGIYIFETLADPWSSNPNKLYSVSQTVFQTITAVISGYEYRTDIEDFGKDKKEWLSKYIEAGDSMPPHSLSRYAGIY